MATAASEQTSTDNNSQPDQEQQQQQRTGKLPPTVDAFPIICQCWCYYRLGLMTELFLKYAPFSLASDIHVSVFNIFKQFSVELTQTNGLTIGEFWAS
jgi:hypothetical protein